MLRDKLDDFVTRITVPTYIYMFDCSFLFVQSYKGTTIKPLVKFLQVKLQATEPKDMYRQLNDKVI